MNRIKALVVAAMLVGVTDACKPKADLGEPSNPGAEAVPVKVLALQEKPVRDSSEYLATLSSRSSVSLYPQIVGQVSHIFVKPGDRVKAGAALVQIDPSQQQAVLSQLIAAKKIKDANMRFAGERAKRTERLVGEGLLSQQDAEQAASERDAAAADVSAAGAQIAVQASQLKFFKITAPFDGTVGDILIKLGDLVMTTTKVTTVDQSAALEANINVPVERAADLNADSLVEVLDTRGAVVGTSRITFIADQANLDTQSLLIKGFLPSSTAFKPAQIVRARVVWSTRPGLKLPTTAVVRQSGQAFAFVIASEGGGSVVKQRGITLGTIDGNDFVVTSGLLVGEQVVVSGVQKLRDGAPVIPKN